MKTTDDHPIRNLLMKVEDLEGKTIKSVTVVVGDPGGVEGYYVCLKFSDGSRGIITTIYRSPVALQGLSPCPAVMEKCGIFTRKEINTVGKYEEAEREKYIEAGWATKRRELETLKNQLEIHDAQEKGARQ